MGVIATLTALEPSWELVKSRYKSTASPTRSIGSGRPPHSQTPPSTPKRTCGFVNSAIAHQGIGPAECRGSAILVCANEPQDSIVLSFLHLQTYQNSASTIQEEWSFLTQSKPAGQVLLPNQVDYRELFWSHAKELVLQRTCFQLHVPFCLILSMFTFRRAGNSVTGLLHRSTANWLFSPCPIGIETR